ncbi:hypothetical protein ACFXJ8_28040 [Nonomuraea sp. NPDC059194]|uniref:hypothetical protein n=1 Tax=Nonomuraea sp. NPDC059194 TaxID=3346764 RepID=UPI00368907B5
MDSELFDLARDLVDPPEWECPGISPHPARARPNRAALSWTLPAPDRYRVHEFTCACTAVYYELISRGGSYLIHKVVQLDTPAHTFAGPWPHSEARRWWLLLLLGDAR